MPRTPRDGDGVGQRDAQAARGDRKSRTIPWIVVSAVAVLAIVASIITVSLARANQSEAETPQPTATTQPTPTATQEPTPSEQPTTETPDPNAPPKVEVGPTAEMRIGPWNATSQFSQKLGPTSFTIPDNQNLILSSNLLNSFPDSCAAMRQEWGVKKLESGKFELLRPAKRCAAAPELYDEVWGLLDAWVGTIKAD
nr:hypothetical protein [Leucobacter edaphi]